MDITSIFAKNINYYLELNNKTRSELANDLGIAKTVVSSWCNGINFPRADKIMLLSEYFNVNFIDFFTEKKSDKSMENILKTASMLDAEYKEILLSQAQALLELQKSK